MTLGTMLLITDTLCDENEKILIVIHFFFHWLESRCDGGGFLFIVQEQNTETFTGSTAT